MIHQFKQHRYYTNFQYNVGFWWRTVRAFLTSVSYQYLVEISLNKLKSVLIIRKLVGLC